MAEFIISHSLDAEKQNKTDRRNIDSASHFALFTTRDNRREHWVALGRTLQRFLLAATAADIAHAYSAWRKRWASPGSIRPSSSAWGTPRHRHTPCAGPLRG